LRTAPAETVIDWRTDGSAMPARFQLVIDCKDPEGNEFDIN